MNYDKNFEKIVGYLFGLEGGYSNHKNDKGGPTNFGITQDTFNSWRKMNNLPLGSVKTDLTRDEARNIYYNMYWKESGADKYTDPRDAMALFDMAVNSGPAEAKRIFNQSNENFYEMLDNRKKYYDDIVKRKPSQIEFYDGWIKRLKTLENNANKMINDGFYKPSYYNELTPFDKGYKVRSIKYITIKIFSYFKWIFHNIFSFLCYNTFMKFYSLHSYIFTNLFFYMIFAESLVLIYYICVSGIFNIFSLIPVALLLFMHIIISPILMFLIFVEFILKKFNYFKTVNTIFISDKNLRIIYYILFVLYIVITICVYLILLPPSAEELIYD